MAAWPARMRASIMNAIPLGGVLQESAAALGSAAPLQSPLPQVRRRLSGAGEPRVRNKLVALLQHAARGVAQNPTASPADVLLFCHSVLSDGAP